MRRRQLNIRPSLRNIRQNLFPDQQSAYKNHRQNLKRIRRSRGYIRKYNEYRIPKRKTALDLEVDIEKPDHLKSLRESATELAQMGSIDDQTRTWLSSRPTTALNNHVKYIGSDPELIKPFGRALSKRDLATPSISNAVTR